MWICLMRVLVLRAREHVALREHHAGGHRDQLSSERNDTFSSQAAGMARDI